MPSYNRFSFPAAALVSSGIVVKDQFCIGRVGRHGAVQLVDLSVKDSLLQHNQQRPGSSRVE